MLQKCKNEELSLKFGDFHKELVDNIINFCIKNKIRIDSFHLDADGLVDSIDYGSWCPATDSSFTMYDEDKRYNELFCQHKDEAHEGEKEEVYENHSMPYLYSI